ncbi:hypothetical protein FF011L_25220 [Roseimaritima multifibrata]|uniref:DUF1853 domain-containing protein n=1 Tax=Roseimaritima multifibrata TaxID=1930274 RepID=A0A517MFU3_9BACT|nr:DUF1853 family protein [Roseimaritima multifibrata]QDS93749.1 hypothetical protein FF011L_25220 [Roseimaritima multifibrata]
MLQSQELRDLTWVVESPFLLNPHPDLPKFDWRSVSLSQLTAFCQEKPSRRVGRYFEGLVLYWLQHVRKIQVVAESLQVRSGKRTLGEIDFLFRDESSKLTHWEVAVKFYLFHPNRTFAGSHYIGPNAGDTFERKRERMFRHQLPLSETHFPDVQQRNAFVKGRIFYHPDDGSQPQLPEGLAPDHLRGNWIHAFELVGWIRKQDGRHAILNKPYWLSPAEFDQDGDCGLSDHETIERLTRHFQEAAHPVLVSHLCESDGLWQETSRTFVVPDHWPGTG